MVLVKPFRPFPFTGMLIPWLPMSVQGHNPGINRLLCNYCRFQAAANTCKDLSINVPTDETEVTLIASSPFLQQNKTELTFDLSEEEVSVHIFVHGKELPEMTFTGLDLYDRKGEISYISGASARNGKAVDEKNPSTFDLKLWMPRGFFDIKESFEGKVIARHGQFSCSVVGHPTKP